MCFENLKRWGYSLCVGTVGALSFFACESSLRARPLCRPLVSRSLVAFSCGSAICHQQKLGPEGQCDCGNQLCQRGSGGLDILAIAVQVGIQIWVSKLRACPITSQLNPSHFNFTWFSFVCLYYAVYCILCSLNFVNVFPSINTVYVVHILND